VASLILEKRCGAAYLFHEDLTFFIGQRGASVTGVSMLLIFRSKGGRYSFTTLIRLRYSGRGFKSIKSQQGAGPRASKMPLEVSPHEKKGVAKGQRRKNDVRLCSE